MSRQLLLGIASLACVATLANANPGSASDDAFAALDGVAQVSVRYAAAERQPLGEEQAAEWVGTLCAASRSDTLDRVAAAERPGLLFYRGTSDPSALLTLDTTSGLLAFHRGFKSLEGEFATPRLPSADAAPDRARAILESLQAMPGDRSEMVLEHVGGVNMGVHRNDGSTEVFEKVVTVRFGRQIGGLKVEGPGSRIIVHMGEGGSLVGLVRQWQDVTAVAVDAGERFTPAELRSIATEILRQAAGRATGGEVEKVEVVLFDDGQGIIEPAVHVVAQLDLEATRVAADGTAMKETLRNPYDYYVPVLRHAKARFPLAADLAPPPEPASDRR